MATQTTKKATKAAGVWTPPCPACSSSRGHLVAGFVTVYTCAACGALHGTCYLGESYGLVSPTWETEAYTEAEPRYFDFTTLGSEVGRRHGWYVPRTRRIVQTG